MSEIRKDIKDSLLSTSANLPAAGSSADTEALDLLGGCGKVELNVKVEATTALVAGKKITATIKESDDGETFAVAPWAGVQTITGNTGSDEFEQRIAIPTTAKRYIKLTATVEASGGDVSSSKFTLEALG